MWGRFFFIPSLQQQILAAHGRGSRSGIALFSPKSLHSALFFPWKRKRKENNRKIQKKIFRSGPARFDFCFVALIPSARKKRDIFKLKRILHLLSDVFLGGGELLLKAMFVLFGFLAGFLV